MGRHHHQQQPSAQDMSAPMAPTSTPAKQIMNSHSSMQHHGLPPQGSPNSANVGIDARLDPRQSRGEGVSNEDPRLTGQWHSSGRGFPPAGHPERNQQGTSFEHQPQGNIYRKPNSGSCLLGQIRLSKKSVQE